MLIYCFFGDQKYKLRIKIVQKMMKYFEENEGNFENLKKNLNYIKGT